MTTRFSRGANALSATLIAAGAAMQAAPALAGAEEDAFTAAGFNMCDAKLIAVYWDSGDVNQMIEEAGDKIIRGFKNQVEEYIDGGRTKNNWNIALCPASDFYSKADIGTIADAWNMSRSDAAKDISLKLLRGEKDAIDDILKS